MRAYVSQLICHLKEYGGSSLFFAIYPFQCIGLLCVRTVLGLSVPRNMGLSVPTSMGPSVPSFHGIAS